MSELTLKFEKHGAERVFDVWRSDGEVYLNLREYSLTSINSDREKVVDSTVNYPLADDGVTVEHNGENWQEYAETRFNRLNNKRFR